MRGRLVKANIVGEKHEMLSDLAYFTADMAYIL